MLKIISENRQLILLIMLAVYVVMSVITLLFYIVDKGKAKRHAWRIPEAVLLGLSWLMGSLGALIGIYGFRHKTNHWYFPVNTFVSLLVHIALFVFVIVV